jgi:hypothetical protein
MQKSKHESSMTLEFSEAKTKKMRSEQVRMNDGSEKINLTAKAKSVELL